MGVIIVFIGLLFVFYGLIKFCQAIFKLLQALYFRRFASEKQLDKKLFKIWKKEKDYKDFERDIDIHL